MKKVRFCSDPFGIKTGLHILRLGKTRRCDENVDHLLECADGSVNRQCRGDHCAAESTAAITGVLNCRPRIFPTQAFLADITPPETLFLLGTGNDSYAMSAQRRHHLVWRAQ